MRFRSEYRGSSFLELLQVDYPQLLPDLRGDLSQIAGTVPHGTTVLAFKFDGGVVVAGDRLATAGMQVASRDLQKVFRTDSHSMMAISGAAGPCIEMARILSVELEHYEKIEGESLELEGKANKLSQMIRQNLAAAIHGVCLTVYGQGDGTHRDAPLWRSRGPPSRLVASNIALADVAKTTQSLELFGFWFRKLGRNRVRARSKLLCQASHLVGSGIHQIRQLAWVSVPFLIGTAIAKIK